MLDLLSIGMKCMSPADCQKLLKLYKHLFFYTTSYQSYTSSQNVQLLDSVIKLQQSLKGNNTQPPTKQHIQTHTTYNSKECEPEPQTHKKYLDHLHTKLVMLTKLQSHLSKTGEIVCSINFLTLTNQPYGNSYILLSHFVCRKIKLIAMKRSIINLTSCIPC